jgi:hypothetical protein
MNEIKKLNQSTSSKVKAGINEMFFVQLNALMKLIPILTIFSIASP